jgi:predicted MPP superfamily phosphohydrolase
MRKTFRTIGEKDYLEDNKFRLSAKRLDRVTVLSSILKSILALLLVLSFVVDPKIWLAPLMGHWALQIFLLIAVFGSCYWIASQYEKDIRGEWVPLHAAVYPRLVYFAMPLFLMRIFSSSLPGRYGAFVFLGLGCLGGIRDALARVFDQNAELTPSPPSSNQPPRSSLSQRWKRVRAAVQWSLRFVGEILSAFWLQIVLFLSAMRACIIFIAYSLVTLGAIVMVCLNKIINRSDRGIRGVDDKEKGRTFTLAHLSDLHFMGPRTKLGLEGQNRNGETRAFFARNARLLSSVDVVAVTGDITDTGFVDEWVEADRVFDIISRAAEDNENRPKFAFVPGNHDINVFASFDSSVKDLQKYDKKLTLFALGKYSNRGLRLIRYLAFWGKWSAENSNFLDKRGHMSCASTHLEAIGQNLNRYANSSKQKSVTASYVEGNFDRIFPSSIEVADKAVIYTLDSNARTWHIIANSYGMFGLGQLYRLWRMLSLHPENHAAVFLLHHHIRPGTKKVSYKNPTWRKRLEEFAMVTVDAFLFRMIIQSKLRQSALVFHGHTHFERQYMFGRHSVICAPSSGYGEGSQADPENIAYIYEVLIDESGNAAIQQIHNLRTVLKTQAS